METTKQEATQIKIQMKILTDRTQKNKELNEEIENKFSSILRSEKLDESNIDVNKLVPLADDIRDIRFQLEATNRQIQNILDRCEL